jgi:hypothetical protein
LSGTSPDRSNFRLDAWRRDWQSFVQKVIKAAAGIGWQAASHGN